ncbi:MAG: ImmA/IrrE family metallo-endopeptidase [Micrococcales bacterium]|nr:ImmA/IrrE family metallo-endopeptidase [Micrococcales bacterium]
MTSSSTSQRAEQRLNPARIRLARERRGMSKVALASRLAVTTRILHRYETEGAPVARADDLAVALAVDPAFFSRPEPTAICVEQGFFRALRRATAAQLGAARAAACIGAELYEWVADRFALPPVVVPDCDQQAPEMAAAALRAVWGRGDEPLPNLVQLSEAHGVRVLSLPTDADTVDAFSLWLDGVPHVFLSTAKTAERSRFDLAHELGHLTMHSRVPPDPGAGTAARQLEKEADAFASAFLMPACDVLANVGREPAVPQVLRIRSYYKVSAMAATRRLYDLGRLTEWSYRQNCVQLTQRGFRSGEPDGICRELSRVFSTVFASLREQGVKVNEVCRALGITHHELHGLTFGQVALPIAGDQRSVPASRPVLSVVGARAH